MSGLKRKEEEIGLVDLDIEQNENHENIDNEENPFYPDEKNKAEWMALAGIIAGGLLLLLLGTLLFEVPLVTAGFVVVIEAVIAVALNNSKIWIHIGIMAAQVVIGILFGKVLFLALAAAYYFTLLLALKLFEL